MKSAAVIRLMKAKMKMILTCHLESQILCISLIINETRGEIMFA